MDAPDATADLFAAIDAGDERRVRQLLGDHPELAAARDGDSISATMHALYRRQTRIAEVLAAARSDLDVFEAAALGRLDRVRDLLAADPRQATARSADGFTALHFPAFFGLGAAAEITADLLAAGADVNARATNGFGVMPLHSAVAGGHEGVAIALIDAGADVNASQSHGWTPLHGAAHNGLIGTVRTLIAAGADRGARNDDGVSAADLARSAGHLDVVDALD